MGYLWEHTLTKGAAVGPEVKEPVQGSSQDLQAVRGNHRPPFYYDGAVDGDAGPLGEHQRTTFGTATVILASRAHLVRASAVCCVLPLPTPGAAVPSAYMKALVPGTSSMVAARAADHKRYKAVDRTLPWGRPAL